MTEFIGTRCLRCAGPATGQYCPSCNEQKRTEESARAERVANSIASRPSSQSTTAPRCPECGTFAGPDARFCAYCRFQFRELPESERELVYAGFWIRFLAILIDWFILGAINVGVGMFVTSLGQLILLEELVAATYSIAFWIGQGATPGKMVVGVKVVMANGGPVEPGGALLRYVGYFVCGLTLGIGYLMIAFSAEKRGLHDNLAGTVVIKSR